MSAKLVQVIESTLTTAREPNGPTRAVLEFWSLDGKLLGIGIDEAITRTQVAAERASAEAFERARILGDETPALVRAGQVELLQAVIEELKDSAGPVEAGAHSDGPLRQFARYLGTVGVDGVLKRRAVRREEEAARPAGRD